MARRKQQRVSKKAGTKKGKGSAWFSKAGGPPEPGAIWHAPFEYGASHGLVVKVRGHWERHGPKTAKGGRGVKEEAAGGEGRA